MKNYGSFQRIENKIVCNSSDFILMMSTSLEQYFRRVLLKIPWISIKESQFGGKSFLRTSKAAAPIN